MEGEGWFNWFKNDYIVEIKKKKNFNQNKKKRKKIKNASKIFYPNHLI